MAAGRGLVEQLAEESKIHGGGQVVSRVSARHTFISARVVDEDGLMSGGLTCACGMSHANTPIEFAHT